MKKTVALLLLIMVGFGSVNAQEQTQERPMTRAEYVEKYKSIAIAHMKRFGIPASITMAQGILESGAGNSELARKSNNHFGIKCKKYWTGAKVYHDDDAKGECFRAYPTVEASYEDHAKFLDESPRYDSLFAYPSDDYRSWARGLKACGYATAPDYAERLVKIIENMKLYLLDQEGKSSPATPTTPTTEGSKVEPKQTTENAIYESKSESAPKANAIKETSVAVSDERVNPNAFRVTVNSHKGYGVYRANHTSYVVAKEGDTFESIGKIFEISSSLLRSFNDVSKDEKLTKGSIVYIERKQTQWLGNAMQHKVAKNETIYSLSQLYGIRLHSLLQLNKMHDGQEVKEGDVIQLQ